MTKFTTKKILILAAVSVAVLAVALNIGSVWGFVVSLIDVASPIIIGFCMAFILNLLMVQFETKVFKFVSTKNNEHKGLKRTLSIFATLLTVALAFALILLVIIPQVVKTTASIAAAFPAFATRVTELARDVLERFGLTPKRISEIILGGEAAFDKITAFVKNDLNSVLKSVVSVGGSIIGGAVDTFFGLFIAIYFLADKERVSRQCRRMLRAILKKDNYKKLSHLGNIANTSFSNFIGGQFIEALVLGLLCFIGMLIFGFPFAPVIAVLISVTALVPIVGAWIGGGISAILILTVNPVKALWFALFLIVLQQLENNLVYPKIVGKKVGLPGVWVIIAVALGTGIFGAAGALISVPLASVMYALCIEFVTKIEKKNVEQS